MKKVIVFTIKLYRKTDFTSLSLSISTELKHLAYKIYCTNFKVNNPFTSIDIYIEIDEDTNIEELQKKVRRYLWNDKFIVSIKVYNNIEEYKLFSLNKIK